MMSQYTSPDVIRFNHLKVNVSLIEVNVYRSKVSKGLKVELKSCIPTCHASQLFTVEFLKAYD